MTEDEYKLLIAEIREEKQIPPFFSDNGMKSLINDGVANIRLRVANSNFINDEVARGLLKNYVFYAYHKRSDEFFLNYNGNIVAWQMSQGTEQ